MTDSQQFRADGHAAIDWAADYLEGLRERPVMSTAAPGDIRSQLPASPPEEAEPFSAVLADLDRVLMDGMTHWNHPRFFAYFGITASEPGILAELLAATLNANGMLWRTSPAVTELEELTLSWLAQLLDLPAGWHGHIEDSASTSTLAALCAARSARPDRRVVVASEHAHSSVDRAARILGLEMRHVPVDDDYRLRIDQLDLSDACAVVATVGTTSTTSSIPCRRSPTPRPRTAPGCTSTAPTAAPPRLPRAPHAGARARRLARRQPAQVALHADRLLLPVHGAPGRPARGVRAHARVPAHAGRRGRDEPQRVRAVARPALPRAQALGGDPMPWALGAAGADPRARAARRAVRRLDSGRARMGAVRTAPFSVVCFRPEGGDALSEALMEAVNAGGEAYLSHTRLGGRHVLRLAIGNGWTGEDDVRAAWDVLRSEAARLGAGAGAVV